MTLEMIIQSSNDFAGEITELQINLPHFDDLLEIYKHHLRLFKVTNP